MEGRDGVTRGHKDKSMWSRNHKDTQKPLSYSETTPVTLAIRRLWSRKLYRCEKSCYYQEIITDRWSWTMKGVSSCKQKKLCQFLNYIYYWKTSQHIILNSRTIQHTIFQEPVWTLLFITLKWWRNIAFSWQLWTKKATKFTCEKSAKVVGCFNDSFVAGDVCHGAKSVEDLGTADSRYAVHSEYSHIPFS